MKRRKVYRKRLINGFGYSDELRYEDLKEGVIRLDDPIADKTASRVISELNFIARKGIKLVTIYIASPGGDVYSSFAIYDAIMTSRKRGISVEAIAEGRAASAAAMIILQAAEVRKAQVHARFMLHEVRRLSFMTSENPGELADELREVKELHSRIVEVLSKRTGKSVETIKRLINRRNVWMSASEALTYGLIDEILEV